MYKSRFISVGFSTQCFIDFEFDFLQVIFYLHFGLLAGSGHPKFFEVVQSPSNKQRLLDRRSVGPLVLCLFGEIN